MNIIINETLQKHSLFNHEVLKNTFLVEHTGSFTDW